MSTHPKELLRQLEQRARRRFGQHFLNDDGIIRRIVSGAHLSPGMRVVEIGPGLGVLTEALVGAGAQVTAVELDRDLAQFIRERYPMVDLIEADAARVNWSEVAPNPGTRVVANLPYNVGTKVVMQMLHHPNSFHSLTVMLQLEVVQRIVADPGSRTYGSLSVRAQARARTVFLATVPPSAFHPPPKVTSAVVRLDLYQEPDFGGVPGAFFDRIVKGAFAQRRKTVANSLGSLLRDKPCAIASLQAAGIDPGTRAEMISLPQYRLLAAEVFARQPSSD